MKSPAFQFYIKQWLGDKDVLLMDWDARGMHLHFMCIAWQEDPPCTLPNDDSVLRKLVGNPPNWKTLKKQIFGAWKLDGGRWIQDGLLREFIKQQRFSESRKHNAAHRWHPNRNDASAEQVQSKCNALQSSSSSTITSSIEEKRIAPLSHIPESFIESAKKEIPRIFTEGGHSDLLNPAITDYLIALSWEYHDLDLEDEIKGKFAHWLKVPLTNKSNVALQFRHWFQMGRKIAAGRTKEDHVGGRKYQPEL